MNLVTGDLWSYPTDWRGVTTNGSLRKNGWNVLGTGCAGECRQLYPDAEREIGKWIQRYGNTVCFLNDLKIFTFPTKHDWFDKQSDLALIVQSAHQLADGILVGAPSSRFLLPRPGVGAGKLAWDDVYEAIKDILPDNVDVITHGI